MPRGRVWKSVSTYHAQNKVQTWKKTTFKDVVWKQVLFTKTDPGGALPWGSIAENFTTLISLQISKPFRAGKRPNSQEESILRNFCSPQLESIIWKAYMQLVWSLFLVFKSTGIGGEEILSLKFGLHLPWNLVSGTTKNFMDWISASWDFPDSFLHKIFNS